MEAAGLLGYWWNQVSADPTYCLNKIQQEMSNTKKNEKESIKRLTLKGLSGAFVVLGFGYSLAIAAFIIEIVHGHRRDRIIKIKNKDHVTVEQPKVKNDCATKETHNSVMDSNKNQLPEARKYADALGEIPTTKQPQGKDAADTKGEIKKVAIIH